MIGSHIGNLSNNLSVARRPDDLGFGANVESDVRTDVSSLPHIAEAVVNLCDAARR